MDEASYLADTRRSYDLVADAYAQVQRDALTCQPVERAVLTLFAELTAGRGGSVADLGCGPGHVTAHLADLGLEVFGLDLSAAMVEAARRSHPALSFRQGQLDDLDLPDAKLAGVVAWYSLIHTPPQHVGSALREFTRVLCADGVLLIAFQDGHDSVHVTRAYDHDVSVTAWRLSLPHMRDLLNGAGLTVLVETHRAPVGRERVSQNFVIARKAIEA